MTAARRLATLERRIPPPPAAGEDCQRCPRWAYRLTGQPAPTCPACGRPVADFETFDDLAAALRWLRAAYRG